MTYFDVSMKSSRDSFERSEMFTRRTATVIISAPDASCARTITAGDEYLPVPTNRREVNVLSAIVKRSMALPISRSPKSSALPFDPLSAADEVHDFHRVALLHERRAEGVAL